MVVSRLLALFRTLWRFFSAGSTPSNLRSVQPDVAAVRADERISRYVLDPKHFDAVRVKFRAFEPPHTDVALSVSRTDGMSEEAVWEHGDASVAAPSGRTIHARGDFTPQMLNDVRANGYGLSVTPDEPPPRHANIIGWPPADMKEVRRSLAQQTAAKARVVPRA